MFKALLMSLSSWKMMYWMIAMWRCSIILMSLYQSRIWINLLLFDVRNDSVSFLPHSVTLFLLSQRHVLQCLLLALLPAHHLRILLHNLLLDPVLQRHPDVDQGESTTVSTEPNEFGLYRVFTQYPTHDPVEFTSLDDVCDAATFATSKLPSHDPGRVFGQSKAPSDGVDCSPYAPFPNASTY
ncbi:hypothetical protein BT96DRAFT_317856 [Gymnopus androsaceus JB14]|uniref:Uncharacterized protein n=1 Tax=Gymnopus androsaceus JB14 TaxID=1447944 RepID=A0A6A4GZL0_9AGAR|nr:hypothetical protein BT96DRAFT_317856 [Gymnopus androsaceus JB14]